MYTFEKLPWSGLSQGEEENCPEPASTEERDELVAALNEAFRGHVSWAQDHWAEGHPDLNALIADYWERIDGLKNRPKLLRCNAAARDKARLAATELPRFIRSLKNSQGATVVPAPGLWFRSEAFPGMRPYFVRGPFPFPGGEKPPARPPEQFPGSSATAPPATTGGAGGGAIGTTAGASSGTVTGILSVLTEGEVLGIPKKYLFFGGLGLLAWGFISRSGRR